MVHNKHACKVLPFTTFGLSFMISSVAPTESSTLYANMITQVENRNHKMFETPGNFGCPKEVKKEMNFSPKRLYSLKSFEICSYAKTKFYSFISFHVKVTSD